MESSRIIIKFRLGICFILLVSPILYGLTLGVGTDLKFGNSIFSLYNEFGGTVQIAVEFSVTHESPQFSLYISLLARNDRYFRDPFTDSYYGGFYFDFGNSSLTLRMNSFSISVGKGYLGDLVESSYPLFASSTHLPRNFFELKYEDERFLYVSRWLELTNLRDEYKPSEERFRGANFKSYVLKAGAFRFGYQEANVYVGKNFDFEFFANPIPGFFIQYVKDAGRPYPEGIGECNFIMGFYADYKTSDFYLYSQILIDDINMNRFLKPNEFQNPDKIAWSLGGSFNTEAGRLAIHHAGATKYTFQPSGEFGNNRFYGYTIYNDFYYKQQDGKDMILPLEFLYVGYKYGENNLAFNVEYVPKDLFGACQAKFNLEYVVLGERSPINAWGELPTPPAGTHLLDDPVLEHRLSLGVYIPWKVHDWLEFKFAGQLGYVWNRSVLVNVGSDNVKRPLLRPQLGNNTTLVSFSLSTNVKLSW